MQSDASDLLKLLNGVCESLETQIDLKRGVAYGAIELLTGKPAEELAAEPDSDEPEESPPIDPIEMAEMARNLGEAQGAEFALRFFKKAVAHWKGENGY